MRHIYRLPQYDKNDTNTNAHEKAPKICKTCWPSAKTSHSATYIFIVIQIISNDMPQIFDMTIPEEYVHRFSISSKTYSIWN